MPIFFILLSDYEEPQQRLSVRPEQGKLLLGLWLVLLFGLGAVIALASA